MSVTVKIDPSLQRKLDTLNGNMQSVLKPAVEESAELIRDYISEVPRKSPGAFTRLATPGQRRAYWAKVKSGEARQGANGYIRRNHIAKAWTIRFTNGGLTATIGNNAPGAVFVQSDAQQQPFHKESGWKTDKQAVEKNQKQINAIINRRISRFID